MSITMLFRTTPASRLRAAARAGIVAATTSVPLLAAATALAANHPYDGEDSGPGLTVLQTLGIYLGIPLGLFMLISFLVVAPGWVRGDRNRREVGWIGQNGTTPTSAARTEANGQASRGSSASSASDVEHSVSAGKGAGTGGASGSW